MASPASHPPPPPPPPQLEQTGLKYLGAVEIAVDKATKYAASIYEFAKDSSGPLKPGVNSVESTVRTVVGPVYQKIEGKPHEILLFIDRKVDDAVGVVEGVVPHSIKDRSCQAYGVAYGVAKHVPDVVKSILSDLQEKGVVKTAKSYYATYEPVAEEWTFAAWKQLLKLPYAPKTVHCVAPPTLFCAEKFNQLVDGLKGKNMPFASYIPTLPVDKLAKAVKAALDH